jgi:hypothetical protein
MMKNGGDYQMIDNQPDLKLIQEFPNAIEGIKI